MDVQRQFAGNYMLDIGHNGLNVALEKRYSAALLFKFNYTYSKMMDNVDSRNELASFPGTDSFTNYYNQANDWGGSGNDIRHRILDSVVGWSLGVIGEARSGTPWSPVMLTNTTNSFSDEERPNVAGLWQLPSSRTTGQEIAEWFHTKAFAAPAAYVSGNAGRTFGEGPGLANIDASLLKDFNISERMEALNVLNHPNFANPNTQFRSATFGQITSEISGTQSRILQLGLHLAFSRNLARIRRRAASVLTP